jgi:hypothetical protein
LKISVTTADASIDAADRYGFVHVIEGPRIARLQWGTANALPITIGFFVKYHRAGTYSFCIGNSNGDYSYPLSFPINSVDTWEFKTAVIPGPTSGTWDISNAAGIYIYWVMAVGSGYAGTSGAWVAASLRGATGGTNGVAATSDTAQLTGVVVLPGSFTLTVDMIPGLIKLFDETLMDCRRYYQTHTIECTFSAAATGNTLRYMFPLVPAMRRSPTLTYSAGTRVNLSGNAPEVPVSDVGKDVRMGFSAAAAGDVRYLGEITCDARM